MFRYRFESLGLCGQMAGNALVEPALDFFCQMNDLGSHSAVLCKYPGLAAKKPGDAEYWRRQWI